MTEESAAFHLSGLLIPGGWTVIERKEITPGKSGGACSVCYLVENKDGRVGFMKAFDYAAAMETEDPPLEFALLTGRYVAERELLELCAGRNLNRVVRILGHGTIRVDGFQPSAVSYLILEKADGDARDAVSEADIALHSPMLRLAHHVSVGVSQLHSIGGAHHDLKPSNVLFWRSNEEANTGTEARLGDLGSAFLQGRPAPQDDDFIAGDPSYSPPEQLYRGFELSTNESWRQAADMYMFGGIVCFLITGVPYTGILEMNLDSSFRWNNWGGTFSDVLPALLDAHDLVTERLQDILHKSISSEISQMIWQLCHPDPNLRGDTKARQRNQNPFSLRRYVTQLNLVQFKMYVEERVSA